MLFPGYGEPWQLAQRQHSTEPTDITNYKDRTLATHRPRYTIYFLYSSVAPGKRRVCGLRPTYTQAAAGIA
jgi:hypothetical protein